MRPLHSVLFVATALSVTTSFAAEPNTAQRMPTVTSLDSSILSENQPVGPTGRPEWTSARRFSSTRVYIQQNPWEVGIGSWWRIKNKRDGTVDNRLLQEIEIGLPYRMQLDMYVDIEGNQNREFHYQGFDVELRWALADWGKIWGNPTLYGEWKFNDPDWGPDVYELKLLLGDDFAQRWHWGLNVIWEAQTGGEREEEFQIAGGLSYSVIDSRLGVGVEFLYNHATVKDGRGDPENQFNIGPSIQIRATKRLHIDLSCLFGTNEDSPRQIGYVIVGYSFGRGEEPGRTYTPATGRQN